jgi:hypothetical protein
VRERDREGQKETERETEREIARLVLLGGGDSEGPGPGPSRLLTWAGRRAGSITTAAERGGGNSVRSCCRLLYLRATLREGERGGRKREREK